MSGNIPDRDKKILCLKSGNRCAIPICQKILVIENPGNDKDSIIAVMAHIKGEKLGAARYDPDMTDVDRNSYPNLILVCQNCHKIIDDQSNTYTVDHLKSIKLDHETWIVESTTREMSNITFKELADVTGFLSSGQVISETSYTVVPPKDKIHKNKLSPQIEGLIVMGLTQAPQVSNYINSHHDLQFADNLAQGFITEYNRLRYVEELQEDNLFYSLLDFASAQKSDFTHRAAGLAVQSYLFEKCEVFEK